MFSVQLANTVLNNNLRTFTSGTGESASTTKRYLGLSTEDPGSDGSGFYEPTLAHGFGVGAVDDDGHAIQTDEYKRYEMKAGDAVATGGILANSGDAMMFNEAQHYSWGVVKWFGVFSSQSLTAPLSTTLLYWGRIWSPKQAHLQTISTDHTKLIAQHNNKYAEVELSSGNYIFKKDANNNFIYLTDSQTGEYIEFVEGSSSYPYVTEDALGQTQYLPNDNTPGYTYTNIVTTTGAAEYTTDENGEIIHYGIEVAPEHVYQFRKNKLKIGLDRQPTV